MGLIKSILVGIVAFFGLIFGLIGGLLGTKKAADSATAPKTRKRSGYYLELEEAQTNQPVNQKQPEKAEPAKAAPVAQSESAPATVVVEPQPKPEPVKAPAPAPVASTNAKAPTQAETTFAPDYLLSLGSTGDRRRPGANMTSFLDMARQVKVPS